MYCIASAFGQACLSQICKIQPKLLQILRWLCFLIESFYTAYSFTPIYNEIQLIWRHLILRSFEGIVRCITLFLKSFNWFDDIAFNWTCLFIAIVRVSYGGQSNFWRVSTNLRTFDLGKLRWYCTLIPLSLKSFNLFDDNAVNWTYLLLAHVNMSYCAQPYFWRVSTDLTTVDLGKLQG